MKKLMILCVILVWGPALFAQRAEIGLIGGISLYSGDLRPNEFGIYLEDARPAYGFFGRLNLSDRLAFRLGLTLAEVKGDGSTGLTEVTQSFRFQSNITDIMLSGEYYFLRLQNPSGNIVFSPFIGLGIGVFHFEAEGQLDDEWIPLQPLGTEGQGLEGYPAPYGLTEFNVPLTLGVRLLFNDRFALGLELGGRKLFTDYLDDISGAQVRYGDVLDGNGPIAARFSNPLIDPTDEMAANETYKRGGEFNDWYYVGGITLSFLLDGAGSRAGRKDDLPCYNF